MCGMSLFKTYTPKKLYESTLLLTNTLFHHPPVLDSNPISFFNGTLKAHIAIQSDLNGLIRTTTTPVKARATIQEVHCSIQDLEKTLFGTKTEFADDIEGCCLYTRYIGTRLSSSRSTCSVV